LAPCVTVMLSGDDTKTLLPEGSFGAPRLGEFAADIDSCDMSCRTGAQSGFRSALRMLSVPQWVIDNLSLLTTGKRTCEWRGGPYEGLSMSFFIEEETTSGEMLTNVKANFITFVAYIETISSMFARKMPWQQFPTVATKQFKRLGLGVTFERFQVCDQCPEFAEFGFATFLSTVALVVSGEVIVIPGSIAKLIALKRSPEEYSPEGIPFVAAAYSYNGIHRRTPEGRAILRWLDRIVKAHHPTFSAKDALDDLRIRDGDTFLDNPTLAVGALVAVEIGVNEMAEFHRRRAQHMGMEFDTVDYGTFLNAVDSFPPVAPIEYDCPFLNYDTMVHYGAGVKPLLPVVNLDEHG